LLDTNVVLIAPEDPARLSKAIQSAVLSGPNYISVVSYWEVMLKKGSLLVGDPRMWWRDVLDELAAAPLLLRPDHVATVYSLPPIHKYPFDRILIAQVITDSLTLVTTDTQISRYATPSLQILS
jgi:PIN domain nuclease of toxin-antitoxin system